MQKELINNIQSIENKWLDILFKTCAGQFSKVHLPSHDALHHKRVWMYAKELVAAMSSTGTQTTLNDLELLIIAAFFHDQGMSITFSEEHGIISRNLCSDFFSINPFDIPQNFDIALDAIELHDRKNYNTNKKKEESYSLHQLLTIADDLDAFSTIGIYRYLEIYLLRNIKVEIIPDKVIVNLFQRFDHFRNSFSFNNQIVINQKRRYSETKRFFQNLANQIENQGYNEQQTEGPVGIVNFIIKEIINKKCNILDASSNIIAFTGDDSVKNFFRKLNFEYFESTNIKIQH